MVDGFGWLWVVFWLVVCFITNVSFLSLSQVSDCNGVVYEIYLDHKF